MGCAGRDTSFGVFVENVSVLDRRKGRERCGGEKDYSRREGRMEVTSARVRARHSEHIKERRQQGRGVKMVKLKMDKKMLTGGGCHPSNGGAQNRQWGSTAAPERKRSNLEGEVAGVLRGSMVLRHAPKNYETTSVT